ncbi:putative DNA-binding transcriptional regulator [Thermoplasmatales archaeon]|nr:putative DNA-binding transcriptional regulator [Thermoplasmatales archaeon]
MNQDYLKAFVDLARSRNMRKTAANLGITEATVSYRLKQLEKMIGHTLFSRESKKLEITQFGKEFYPDAIQVVSILDKYSANHTLNIASKVIKVSSGEIAAIYVLPGLIKSFKDKNRDITVDMEIGSSYEIVQELVDANSDVGFVVSINFPEFHSILSKMSVTELTSIDLIFIAPRDCKFLDRKIVAPKDIVGMPYISRYANSGVQSQVEQILAKAGITENDLNIVFRLENSSSVISAVSEGLGVSIVAMVQAEKHIKNGSIGWLPLDTDLKTSLYLVDRWNGTNDTVNRLVAFTKFYMDNYINKKEVIN